MLPRLLLPFFVLLLLFPGICVKGAANGLSLWLFTLVPTFFPFLFLSNLMISYRMTDKISSVLSHIMRPLFRISAQGCYIVLMGFLCGYPMGAKLCGDFVAAGYISKEEGEYLITFCNNPSPMFLIGYIMSECMHESFSHILILTLFYATPIFTGILLAKLPFSPYYHKKTDFNRGKLNNSANFTKDMRTFAVIQKSMLDAFQTLLYLGGYVILFNILSVLCFNLFQGLPMLNYIFAGFLEMTTGAMYLKSCGLTPTIINLLIPLTTIFGGCSTLAQTKAMLTDSKISIWHYLLGKILQVVVFSLGYFFLLRWI
ncbi:MAG: hypothetical protein E7269_03465 [Lachnospiraceae bacterium]|nr:hypothetical protein [Lachnospiraceae bacterium]